ncbi:MAG: CBS domain-containing protein [Patescibacteria group bacterium]
MDTELYTISKSATVLEAADKIQRNHLRCVMVLEGEKVVGVCSQGDILRLLLNGGNVYTIIDKVLKPSFVFLKEKDWNKAFLLMKQHGITLVPILDNEFRLLDVITMPMIFEKVTFNP